MVDSSLPVCLLINVRCTSIFPHTFTLCFCVLKDRWCCGSWHHTCCPVSEWVFCCHGCGCWDRDYRDDKHHRGATGSRARAGCWSQQWCHCELHWGNAQRGDTTQVMEHVQHISTRKQHTLQTTLHALCCTSHVCLIQMNWISHATQYRSWWEYTCWHLKRACFI